MHMPFFLLLFYFLSFRLIVRRSFFSQKTIPVVYFCESFTVVLLLFTFRPCEVVSRFFGICSMERFTSDTFTYQVDVFYPKGVMFCYV